MFHFGVLSDHFGGPGATGTPNRHLEVPLSISTDFRIHSGSLLGPTLAPFCCFCVIAGTKMGDSFQVHVFGDPGMEMMPECIGCMCYKHNKTYGFSDISLFPLIEEFSVSREGFRCHFCDFW